MWKETPEGIILPLKITAKASRNEVLGWENNELKVRIAAVPEKGNANEELIRFLAKQFGVSKSSIKILSGEASRHKKICIHGLSLKAAYSLIWFKALLDSSIIK